MSQLHVCLEELTAFYSSHKTLVCGGILVVCAGITVTYRTYQRWMKQRKANQKRKDYPRDTVIFHDVARGPYAPSSVPFAIKLETFLRMAKIPYQCDHGYTKSAKNKWPWITYNGEDMSDSSFIIEFLKKRYNVDFNTRLSTEERAIAVAFQRMLEESLYWVTVVTRWVNEIDAGFMASIIPYSRPVLFVKMFITPNMRKMTWAQGIGRHSQEEVRRFARKDLTALNNFLGKKKFLMGDEPCEEDCAVFGQLAQIYWQLPSSVGTMFREEFPLLVAYCERMKERYWPDWVQCTTQGGTVKATH